MNAVENRVGLDGLHHERVYKGNIDYRKMFGCEAGNNLVEDRICDELFKIDQIEYPIVELENREIEDAKFWKIVTNRVNKYVLGALAVPLGAAMIAFPVNTLLVVGGTGTLTGTFLPITMDATMRGVESVFSERRRNRLEMKVRDIAERLKETEDPIAKRQLLAAKIYFENTLGRIVDIE